MLPYLLLGRSLIGFLECPAVRLSNISIAEQNREQACTCFCSEVFRHLPGQTLEHTKL